MRREPAATLRHCRSSEKLPPSSRIARWHVNFATWDIFAFAMRPRSLSTCCTTQEGWHFSQKHGDKYSFPKDDIKEHCDSLVEYRPQVKNISHTLVLTSPALTRRWERTSFSTVLVVGTSASVLHAKRPACAKKTSQLWKESKPSWSP